MERKIKILAPTMPNYITYEVPAGNRQDGFKPNNNSFPIAMLSQEEALEYAELMKQTFIKHWEYKRK